MVKKLWKHEFLSYARLLIPVYVAVLGLAVLARGLQFFEVDSVSYDVVLVSSVILCIFSMVVAAVLSAIFVILRFYRHLFTGEGYLTFTLPVTPGQHLWVKLSCACVCEWATLAVILLAALVLGFGDVNTEVFKAFGYLFGKAYAHVGSQIYLFMLELLALMVVSTVSGTLVYYSCISIGQTFKKNRIRAAVITYFAYNVITQVISTVLSSAFSNLPVDKWMETISKNPYPYIHIFMAVLFAVGTVVSLLFFFLTRYILRNKLNLE